MMRLSIALMIALVSASAAIAAPHGARCVVTTADGTFREPCIFEAQRGGSFTISPTKGRFGRATDEISVMVVRPGVAEVRGLTAEGINSRWGEARRASRDRACWVGSDFSVCAY